MEAILSREADKKGMSGRSKDRYIYGGMNNMGFMKSNKETDRGREAEQKHNMDMRGGNMMHSEPDTDEQGGPPDNDADDRGGFMSKGSAPKKKRGFMRA